eukprot:Rmarinus@m.6033
MEERVILALVKSLKDCTDVRVDVFFCLRSLYSCDDLKASFVTHNCVTHVAAILSQEEDPAIVKDIIAFLQHLVNNAYLESDSVWKCIRQILVKLMQNDVKSASTRLQVYMKNGVYKSKFPTDWITHLFSSLERVERQDTVFVIIAFLQDLLQYEKCTLALLKARAVPRLMNVVVQSESSVVRKEIVLFLKDIAKRDITLKSAILNSSVFPQLVSLLERDIHDFDEARANVDIKVSIVEAGAIPRLVRLLNSPDLGVQKEAIRCLRNLAVYERHQSLISDAGAIRPLVERLEEFTDSVMLEQVTGCLANLAENVRDMGDMIDRIIHRLKALLDKPSISLHGHVAVCLRRLAMDDGNMEKIAKEELVNSLINKLSWRTDNSVAKKNCLLPERVESDRDVKVKNGRFLVND